MRMEKHVLIEKNCLKMSIDMGLSVWDGIEKTVYRVKIYWRSNKEKVPGEMDRKEDHADSLLAYERTHHYWFPWKKVQL